MWLLSKYGVDIKLRNTSILKIQRENDDSIMDNVLTNSSSITTLKKTNACCLYLQVTFLSDTTNLEGDSLLPNFLQEIQTQHRTSKYDWPLQQRPNYHSWKLWKQMLHSIYYSSSSNRLQQSFRLKRWIKCTMVKHRYQYSPIEKQIY